MKKQIEIVVPTDYSAIPLKKYLKIQKDFDMNEEDENVQNAYLLYNFCGITPQMAVQLDSSTLNSVLLDLKKLLSKTDYELQRFITIDNVEYGFEPNLSKIPYGAYLDLSSYQTIALDDNWQKIMTILYRPVTKKRGVLYEIEPYKGFSKKDTQKWLEVSMDFHFGVFFYFLNLYKVSLNATLNSMKNHPEISPNIKSVLEKSGELIQLLHNSQEKIF